MDETKNIPEEQTEAVQPEAVDAPNAVIEEQVTNGVAVRMALLYRLAG